jgi:hypothetical protein
MGLELKLTLDTNCLIDLDLNEGASVELRQLLALHENGLVALAVPGIGASERLPARAYAPTFKEFHRRIQSLAAREIEILKPLAYWDITYWDWCVYAGDDSVALERKIHRILFPRSDFAWNPQSSHTDLAPNGMPGSQDEGLAKWRNRKCDTLGMWCHIHYHADGFVTRDRNFHKRSKKPELIELGAKLILKPGEAIAVVRQAP